jgi:hypothetical protein
VTLTDTVPANTTFNTGASTAGWACVPDNNAGSTCTLTIGALAAGSGPQAATFAVDVDKPGSDRHDGHQQYRQHCRRRRQRHGSDAGDNSDTDTTPANTEGEYHTITPCRLVDTRDPVGPYGAPPLATLPYRK